MSGVLQRCGGWLKTDARTDLVQKDGRLSGSVRGCTIVVRMGITSVTRRDRDRTTERVVVRNIFRYGNNQRLLKVVVVCLLLFRDHIVTNESLEANLETA